MFKIHKQCLWPFPGFIPCMCHDVRALEQISLSEGGETFFMRRTSLKLNSAKWKVFPDSYIGPLEIGKFAFISSIVIR